MLLPPRADRHVLFAGLTSFDVIQFYGERPEWGTKGTAADSHADVGGPAANAAVTVALLGGRARLVSAIGQGVVADVVRARLAQLGVEAIDLAGDDTQLPVSSIWVEMGSGSRTVISTNRATTRVGGAGNLVVGGTAAVLVDGHHPAICEAAVKQAVERGLPIVLDGGSWKPVLSTVLPHVAVAILSGDFTLPGSEARGLELAAALRDRFGVQDVAITRGAESVLSLSPGGEEEVAVARGEVVDTLGAGDVFHGAYMYFRYLVGHGHRQALEGAARVATESCAHVGAREGVRRAALQAT